MTQTPNDTPPTPTRDRPSCIRILGIPFLDGPVDAVVTETLAHPGLVVAPAAPALGNLTRDSRYREALLNTDVAITDSILMIWVWRLLTRHQLHRVSGLTFLRELLNRDVLRQQGALFLVNPTEAEQSINIAWLKKQGINLGPDDCHLAPHYGATIEDQPLLAKIMERRPRIVMINIGGGVQEPLGWWLRKHLDDPPMIACTGAAIAFLTGSQASISPLADRLGLGWLIRCVSSPRRYVPRYAASFRLVGLMRRFRDRPPPGPDDAGPRPLA